MPNLLWLADNRRDDSLAARLRRRRFALFNDYLARVPRPLTVLDVGGTVNFWQRMGLDAADYQVVILNLPDALAAESAPSHRKLSRLVGDATALESFADHSFGVLFSNSVIEHVGDWAAQQRMAAEVQRVARAYFVQTPNRAFPIEPHFHVPLFQFLPIAVRVAMVQRAALGWYPRVPDRAEAEALVRSIRLLSGGEMQRLFPKATLHRERLMGLTKSFIAAGGFG